jgi:choline dehydrogenase
LFLSPVTEYSYFLRSDQIPPPRPSESENDASCPENLSDLELAWIPAWGTVEKEVPKIDKQYGFNTILVQCGQIRSTGNITLVDRDARTPPIVDPNYLSDNADFELLRKGIEFGLEIGKKIMEKSNVIFPMHVPEDTSASAIDDFIRKYVSGAYHLCSTCRMAKRENNGVVDQHLRVHGVEGLRVADASIFPRLMRVKPQATVVMVAEKCAEIILNQN